MFHRKINKTEQNRTSHLLSGLYRGCVCRLEAKHLSLFDTQFCLCLFNMFLQNYLLKLDKLYFTRTGCDGLDNLKVRSGFQWAFTLKTHEVGVSDLWSGAEVKASELHPESVIWVTHSRSTKENQGSQFPFHRKCNTVMLTKVITSYSEKKDRTGHASLFSGQVEWGTIEVVPAERQIDKTRKRQR